MPLRHALTLLLPGGLVVAVAVAVLRPGIAPDFIQPYIGALAVLVLAVGIFLAWHYKRSRIVFPLLVLAVADLALRWLANGDALRSPTGSAVIGTLGVLVPLNLAGSSLLAEKSLLTVHSLKRLLPLLAQVVVAGLVVDRWPSTPQTWLDHRFLDAGWTAWTALPQMAVAAFAFATFFLIIRCLWRQDPLDAGLVWAVAAAFAALNGVSRGWAPTAFFTTGGWVLIGSLMEATGRTRREDDLTGLPGPLALRDVLQQLGGDYVAALVSVDHFKHLKRTFGREVADQVLRMIATQLGRVSGGGTVFRHGRETFVILFSEIPAEEAVPHLDAVRRAIASYCFVLRGPRRPRKKPAAQTSPTGPRVVITVTVSIGVAARQHHHRHAKHVLRASGNALRHAIATGRNQVIA